MSEIDGLRVRGSVAEPNEDNWAKFAACTGEGEVFQAENMTRDTIKEAKRICARCAVRSYCLDYALTNGESYGIWGGKTVRERKKIAESRGSGH